MVKNSKEALSIIIPTLNEVENIEQLVKRIHFSLEKHAITHEIICIDDASDDGTVDVVTQLSQEYPFVKLIRKPHTTGKASSLLQGFSKAKHPIVCMIDADLQYPPEAIASMYEQLHDLDVDIVVTERTKRKTTLLRKLQSIIFNLFFTRLLFGINYDSQSGLKLFKKKVLSTIDLTPSPWGFDLEFLVRSLERQYKIISHKIVFSERSGGVSKTSSISTSLELAKASFMLRLNSSFLAVRRGYLKSRPLRAITASRQHAANTLSILFTTIGLVSAVGLALVPAQSTHALTLGDTLDTLTGGMLSPIISTPTTPTTTQPTTTIPILQPTTPVVTQPTAPTQPTPAAPTTTPTQPTVPSTTRNGASNSTPATQAPAATATVAPINRGNTGILGATTSDANPYDAAASGTQASPTVPYANGLIGLIGGLAIIAIGRSEAIIRAAFKWTYMRLAH